MGEWTDTCAWDVTARQTLLLCILVSAEVSQCSDCEHVKSKDVLLLAWRSECLALC
jgi:hypothetical protein